LLRSIDDVENRQSVRASQDLSDSLPNTPVSEKTEDKEQSQKTPQSEQAGPQKPAEPPGKETSSDEELVVVDNPLATSMTLSRVEVQESSFKSEPAQPEEKVTPDTSSTSPTTEEQAHLSRKTKSFFLAGRLRPFYIWFFFLFFSISLSNVSSAIAEEEEQVPAAAKAAKKLSTGVEDLEKRLDAVKKHIDHLEGGPKKSVSTSRWRFLWLILIPLLFFLARRFFAPKRSAYNLHD